MYKGDMYSNEVIIYGKVKGDVIYVDIRMIAGEAWTNKIVLNNGSVVLSSVFGGSSHKKEMSANEVKI
jgi:hypothetical protein